MRGVSTAGERLLSNPITGSARCCARAAIGHAAAPLRRVMIWRRFMANMAPPSYRLGGLPSGLAPLLRWL